MKEIIAVANKVKIPLICDEVYYGLSYDENRPFLPFASVGTDLPMVCIGSLSKLYCVPGWRLGWTIVYNRHGYFD
jgi:tyrosine aminotransferase